MTIEGDATLARDLSRLFAGLEPDWQAPLDGVLGQEIGYQVGEGLRRGAAGLREFLKGSADMAGRHLRENSDTLASTDEIDGFCGAVDELRDGTERLDARLTRLERRRAAAED